jgi:hypothetical protein
MSVQRACWGFGRTDAMMPPDAEATMGATMGRSQAAVMVERLVLWWYILWVAVLASNRTGEYLGWTYSTKGR